jgi:hypothetical protein
VSPDDQPQLDPDLADAVRRTYVRPLDEVTARRHVSAIIATATAGAEPVAQPSRRRRRRWRALPAVIAATLLVPGGLAVAGVRLPDAVEQPYRAIGITLPHQTTREHPRPTPRARPVTPRTTPAGPARTKPAAEPRKRPTPAGNGARHARKPQASPSPRAGRQDKRRGRPASRPNPPARAKPPGQGPRRSTAPHGPASPKPGAGPKPGHGKPRSPRGR